jgi:hypothetical protein
MKIDNPILLGQATGFGIPAAGTSGQVLRKIDGTDYNTQWANNGLPAGGTSGQSLVKNSSTSGDASWVDNGSQATYVQAHNQSQQSFTFQTETTVTGWTNNTDFTQNAAEWNPTTGVFTATKAGWYRISAGLEFANAPADGVGRELVCLISVNNSIRAQSANVAQAVTTGIIRHTGHAHYIAKLAIGDTIRIRCYQDLTTSISLRGNSFGTTISIQEIPSRLTR